MDHDESSKLGHNEQSKTLQADSRPQEQQKMVEPQAWAQAQRINTPEHVISQHRKASHQEIANKRNEREAKTIKNEDLLPAGRLSSNRSRSKGKVQKKKGTITTAPTIQNSANATAVDPVRPKSRPIQQEISDFENNQRNRPSNDNQSFRNVKQG